jgi:hypothetical protein
MPDKRDSNPLVDKELLIENVKHGTAHSIVVQEIRPQEYIIQVELTWREGISLVKTATTRAAVRKFKNLDRLKIFLQQCGIESVELKLLKNPTRPKKLNPKNLS